VYWDDVIYNPFSFEENFRLLISELRIARTSTMKSIRMIKLKDIIVMLENKVAIRMILMIRGINILTLTTE
jgi:hypothetical protein